MLHIFATLPKFNIYRFAIYKEEVINLLLGVCTISIETIKIVKQMQKY